MRPMHLVPLAMAVMIALALALTAARAADEPAAATGSVTGTIVDAAGNPVEGAIVSLQQAAVKMRYPIRGTTATDGTFTLEKVPEGTYNLKANTPDAKGSATKEVQVFEGRETKAGTLKLVSTKRR